MKVMVETSAHHVHVSEADLEALFGKGAALTNKKDLSQPGQFACEEKVEVVGPKGTMKMSILGPTRPETQVEISLTDARKLGVTAPTRESGDLEGTPGCVLRGPAGEVTLEKGVIAGAGLDVFEHEPNIPAALRGMPNVVLGAHMATATYETRSEMVRLACKNIIDYLEYGQHPNLVNPEVLANKRPL